MSDHDMLIDALCDDAGPVRRPAPAAVRALTWTLVCLACGRIATSWLHAPWARAGSSGLFGTINIATCLAAGAFLLISAFEISIPGRRSRFLAAAALCISAWLGASIADLATANWPVGRLGEGSYCFRFIVCACAPMTVIVVVALRRTYSVRPLRTALTGAAGIGFLAFALLAFCHHGRLHLMDFSMHLAAVALVIAASAGFGWRFVSIPREGRGAWRYRDARPA